MQLPVQLASGLRPLALRPCLSAGLPFSVYLPGAEGAEKQ
jgi:hypothetical protein